MIVRIRTIIGFGKKRNAPALARVNLMKVATTCDVHSNRLLIFITRREIQSIIEGCCWLSFHSIQQQKQENKSLSLSGLFLNIQVLTCIYCVYVYKLYVLSTHIVVVRGVESWWNFDTWVTSFRVLLPPPRQTKFQLACSLCVCEYIQRS